MKITTKTLAQIKACPTQVALFKRVFPTGARLTLKNVRLALDSKLNVEYFANKILAGKKDLWAMMRLPLEVARQKLWTSRCDAKEDALHKVFPNGFNFYVQTARGWRYNNPRTHKKYRAIDDVADAEYNDKLAKLIYDRLTRFYAKQAAKKTGRVSQR